MTPLMTVELIIVPILLIALLVLAIAAYRAKRTIALLLLLLASIFYSFPRCVTSVIALLSWSRGWKTLGSMGTWMYSWWPLIVETCTFLFLGFLIGAFIFFIRERNEITTPYA